MRLEPSTHSVAPHIWLTTNEFARLQLITTAATTRMTNGPSIGIGPASFALTATVSSAVPLVEKVLWQRSPDPRELFEVAQQSRSGQTQPSPPNNSVSSRRVALHQLSNVPRSTLSEQAKGDPLGKAATRSESERPLVIVRSWVRFPPPARCDVARHRKHPNPRESPSPAPRRAFGGPGGLVVPGCVDGRLQAWRVTLSAPRLWTSPSG